MAKATTSYALKGEFNFSEGTITEIVGKGENQMIQVYNLMAVLQEFNGCFISVSIKEDKSIPTVDQRSFDDDEDFEDDEE